MGGEGPVATPRGAVGLVPPKYQKLAKFIKEKWRKISWVYLSSTIYGDVPLVFSHTLFLATIIFASCLFLLNIKNIASFSFLSSFLVTDLFHLHVLTPPHL